MRGPGLAVLLVLDLLEVLLAGPHLSVFKLLHVEGLTVSQQLLTLVLQSLSLSVHDGLQFFKVSQFNLQLLHLGLHQQSHKRFDLPLFHCGQMLGFDSSGSERRSSSSGQVPLTHITLHLSFPFSLTFCFSLSLLSAVFPILLLLPVT